MSKAKHDQLYQDLIDLKLNHIAEHYREVLDDSARKNSPLLDELPNKRFYGYSIFSSSISLAAQF